MYARLSKKYAERYEEERRKKEASSSIFLYLYLYPLHPRIHIHIHVSRHPATAIVNCPHQSPCFPSSVSLAYIQNIISAAENIRKWVSRETGLGGCKKEDPIGESQGGYIVQWASGERCEGEEFTANRAKGMRGGCIH